MMKRRTLLHMAGALMALPPAAKIHSQTPRSVFADREKATLTALAEVTLPASIGEAARQTATTRFIIWHASYKPGADMGHGYGASTLRAPAPAAVFPRYAVQFAALDEAARAQGATTFADAPVGVRRTIAEAALNTPQAVNRLPARPTGANLVADFMGLYFNSAAAFDQAYRVAIGRDECRGLDGSDQPPAPLAGAVKEGR